MLGDKRLLRTIRLKNLLSFGPDSDEIELKSLNVLVGANGAGKSNLIEAIDLLRATAGDAQLAWRPRPSEWNVLQCFDHLKTICPPHLMPLRVSPLNIEKIAVP